MQFSKIANFVGAAGIKSIKCDFVFPYPTPLGMLIIQPIDRDGRCDAQPTPSPLARLLTCDVAFAAYGFDNPLFWIWIDFRHMMCVSIKHPVNPSNGTCCDASMPCVVEGRVISHHQATLDCPQKLILGASGHGKWIQVVDIMTTVEYNYYKDLHWSYSVLPASQHNLAV